TFKVSDQAQNILLDSVQNGTLLRKAGMLGVVQAVDPALNGQAVEVVWSDATRTRLSIPEAEGMRTASPALSSDRGKEDFSGYAPDMAQSSYTLADGSKMTYTDITNALGVLEGILKDYSLFNETSDPVLKNVSLTLPLANERQKTLIKRLLVNDFSLRRIKPRYALELIDQEDGVKLVLTSSKENGFSFKELQQVNLSIMIANWMKTIQAKIRQMEKMVSDRAMRVTNPFGQPVQLKNMQDLKALAKKTGVVRIFVPTTEQDLTSMQNPQVILHMTDNVNGIFLVSQQGDLVFVGERTAAFDSLKTVYLPMKSVDDFISKDDAQNVLKEILLKKWHSQSLEGFPGKGWVIRTSTGNLFVQLSVRDDIETLDSYQVMSINNDQLIEVRVPLALFNKADRFVFSKILHWLNWKYWMGYDEDQISQEVDTVLATPLSKDVRDQAQKSVRSIENAWNQDRLPHLKGTGYSFMIKKGKEKFESWNIHLSMVNSQDIKAYGWMSFPVDVTKTEHTVVLQVPQKFFSQGMEAGVKSVLTWLNARYSFGFSDVEIINEAGYLAQVLAQRMENSDNAALAVNGGIDLNAQNMGLDVTKNGKGVDIKFDPAMVAEFRKGDFSGVVPVIIQITPIVSPMMTLGLEVGQDEVKLAKG
ncbi:MAG: hypothetical protein V2A70_07255, partial [Candidatus Omnitrophota bacterium]